MKLRSLNPFDAAAAVWEDRSGRNSRARRRTPKTLSNGRQGAALENAHRSLQPISMPPKARSPIDERLLSAKRPRAKRGPKGISKYAKAAVAEIHRVGGFSSIRQLQRLIIEWLPSYRKQHPELSAEIALASQKSATPR